MVRLTKKDLHRYQRRAIDFVKDTNYCGLFIGCGLGKSIITLTAIQEMMDEVEIEKVLVVAPKKVAESTWSDEVEKWSHLKHIRTSIILGDEKKRTKALLADADIYVTSRDNFVWLVMQYLGASKQPLKTRKWPFDMVVIDELTSFKSSTSKRFKYFKRMRPFMRRVVGLTGTPTPNGLKDLWGQMYCIDMGDALGRTKTGYINNYFNTFSRGGIIINMTPRPGAEEQIVKKISPKVLTMKAEDYLELPPMIEQTRWVRLPEKDMARYKDFEKECVLQFSEDDAPVSVASNAAVLCNKLLQYSNGAIYTDDGGVMELNKEKLDTAVEIIQDARDQGENVLVFYSFQHDADRLTEALKGMKVRRYKDERDLKDWNDGKIEVLLTHPASTAYGLNLQRGGHIIVWYGTGWNAELYEQGNARLARQGQEKPVVVYRLVCKDTMDERAMNAVIGKISSQKAMIQSLKEMKRMLR